MIIAMKGLNEEHYVDRCLRTFHDEKFCERVIVIDGGSTDLTVQELKKWKKVRVFVHPWNFHYHDMEVCQSNIVLSYVPNGQIMMIMDFDEEMSPELVKYLQSIDYSGSLQEGVAAHFSRKTYELIRYEGSPHAMINPNTKMPIIAHQIGQYPDYQCRLFRRTPQLHWVNSPHHVLKGSNSQSFIDVDILHYEKNDLRDRRRIEIQWARAQARRIELGLSPDVFETKPKIEIAEYYDPEVWE